MNERNALFRPEVVVHRSQQSFSVLMDFHYGLLPVLCWLLIILSIFGLTLLALVNYRETETAAGILQPSNGSQKIVAPTASMVKQVMVKEGQSVDKGQILVALSLSVFNYAGKLSQFSQIQQLQSEQTLLRKQIEIQGEIQHQASAGRLVVRASLQTSIETADREARLLVLQLGTSERALDSVALLLESASVSQSQYDQYHAAYLGLLRQQQEIAQRRQQLSRQLNELMAQQLQSELHFKQEQLESLNRLDVFDYEIETLSHQEAFTVVAEAEGVVAAIAIKEGQPVAARQLLLHINPHSPDLEAAIYVPSRMLGKLFTGQEVMLGFDAFDYRYYGRYPAVVNQISRASLDPREQLLPVSGISEPVFKVLLSLNQQYVEGPDIARLQAGMLLRADFITAEMSLLSFIFKPLLRLRGRVW